MKGGKESDEEEEKGYWWFSVEGVLVAHVVCEEKRRERWEE